MRPVMQTTTSECGLACLAMVAAAFGRHEDLAQLRRRLPSCTQGWNLAQLISAAGVLGLWRARCSWSCTSCRS